MTASPDPHPLLRGVDPLPSGPEGLVCSARDCRDPAAYDLRWNNPKIHTPDRRKHWLACTAHRESLSSFLSTRGFLREVEDLPGASG
ncbi:MAG TPA: acetone carboxylase [Microlunatus sp.]|nr:acetone carboxylase [Microlunatus sp.]